MDTNDTVETLTTPPAEEPRTPKTIPRLTEQQLVDLAVDINKNVYFTSIHVVNPSDIPMVFMPIALGAFADWTEEEVKQVGLIYEKYSEAGPRSINGYPTFFSCKILGIEDAGILFEKLRAIEEFEKSLKSGLSGASNEQP